MLVVQNVCKAYGSKEVLRNISLAIEDGEVYGLVGKNGAGKTTLISILAGIIQQTAGEVSINGEPIGPDSFSNGLIGYLPDFPSFYDYLSVDEYVKFLFDGRNIADFERKRTREYLRRFDVDINSRIKTLSRGNKQKVGIIASVIGSPKVLLLDEPTSALDPVGRKDVMDLIKELKRDGITTILSTHILADLELVCDRVGFLHNRTIVREVTLGIPNELSHVMRISFPKGTKIPSEIYTQLEKFQPEVGEDFFIVHLDDFTSQCQLFEILSKFPCPILRIEPVEMIHLETIMNEVIGT